VIIRRRGVTPSAAKTSERDIARPAKVCSRTPIRDVAIGTNEVLIGSSDAEHRECDTSSIEQDVATF
jgi:hypothetical protein